MPTTAYDFGMSHIRIGQSLEVSLLTERDELYLIVAIRLSTASITVPLL
jgi:hypothetical protein